MYLLCVLRTRWQMNFEDLPRKVASAVACGTDYSDFDGHKVGANDTQGKLVS